MTSPRKMWRNFLRRIRFHQHGPAEPFSMEELIDAQRRYNEALEQITRYGGRDDGRS